MTAAIASLDTPCCIGITNGREGATTLDPSNWIADFRMDPLVCPDGRESIQLIVDGYEPTKGEGMPISKLVMLKVIRKDLPSMPFFQFAVNNANLLGKPELKWSVC